MDGGIGRVELPLDSDAGGNREKGCSETGVGGLRDSERNLGA